jgi:hypothetical protein
VKKKRQYTDGKLFTCICVICGRTFKSSRASKKTCPPLYSKNGILLKDCRKEFLKQYNAEYNRKYYEENTEKVLVKNRLWWKEVGKLKYKKKRRKKRSKKA